MNLRIALLAAAWVGAASLSVAQQTPSSQDNSTTTTTPSTQKEAPTSSSTNPAAASSPHQRQAMAKGNDKMMKDCVAKQRSDHSGMSKSDARKACKEQLKSSDEPTSSEPANR